MTARILIVDDERIALRNLEHVMKKAGYRVTGTQSPTQALTLLDTEPFDIVLTDLKMDKVDGLQLLQHSRKRQPGAEVIMITGYATLDSAVEAMRQGAFHYVAKPYRLDEVRETVARALDKIALRRENLALRGELEQFQGKVRIITQDPAMLRLLEMARQVAPTGCNVLITGESGTGKELFARYLHAHSDRADLPFIAVNCGAFNEDLLANELFGHEKGAFTGATGKTGLIEVARGGTLFLDEVTEMSPAMQVKLLRVIQEREMLRVGGTRPVRVEARYIAATNRDLQEEVRAGRFRQDFYFRLNVVNLHIPPLAARKGDVPLLAWHFLSKCAALLQKPVDEIEPQVLDRLSAHDFPGNVRELENLIERAVVFATGSTLGETQLPEALRASGAPSFQRKEGRIATLEEQEMDYIRWVLAETHGNQTLAAQILGIDRVSLWRKLKRRQGGDAS